VLFKFPDPPLLVVYLNSPYGQKQLRRLSGGAIFDHVSLHAIPNIKIYTINSLAQKYIGEKVRQAEVLKSFAKFNISKAENVFNDLIQWSDEILNVSKIGKLRPDELESRLDLKYNSPQRLAILRHIKKASFKSAPLNELVEISAMVGWKGLTTEFYRKSGPWLLRGVEFNNGVIDFEKLVSIDREKFIEQPQIHLEKGDIAFSKDGTIGKAVVIPELNNDLAAGSTIARLRLKKHLVLNPYYLDFVLNHKFVNTQVESFATGVAQPHITQEWIAQLIIPLIESQEVVGELVRAHHRKQWFSKILISISKFLLEGLIDGLISEEELIQAQNALEQGDASLDRAILSQMTEDGYAVAGSKPLFSDLDEFYDLLEQAKALE
jgi:type I restriction enzyme S subunit